MTPVPASDKEKRSIAGTSGPIAYLTSQYPASSHTFIRREIAELREKGLDILTYSIRKPVSGLDHPMDIEAKDQTFYVLGQGATRHISAHGAALFKHPARYFKTLNRAMQHRVPGGKALLWSLFHFVESITLADQLRADNVSHLHNHFANSAANVGMLAAYFAKIPWSMTLHGISETDYPAGLLLGEKVAAAEFVACVSWFGRAQAMRISSPKHWGKFHTVRCGIALDRMPKRQPESLSGSPKRIICVARLSSEKGIIGLLEAFAGARKDGLEAELELLGDGPEKEAIEEKCKKLGIEGDVSFLGRRSEPDTLSAIAEADLLVLPSFMEGLPVVLMEAMALGVPVVASRVAGVPELIDDGENGRLFHPADWKGLQTAMLESLTNPEQSMMMASKAEQTIAREFDIKVAVSPLPKLFADSIAQSE